MHLSLTLGWGSMYCCVVMFLDRGNGPTKADLLLILLPCSTGLTHHPRGWSDVRGSYQFLLHRIRTPLYCKVYFFISKFPDSLVFVVTFDDVEGGSEGLAPIVDLSWSDVASAEDGWDFVGGDHFFVLGGDLCASEGDVKISTDQGELTHLLLFGHVDINNNILWTITFIVSFVVLILVQEGASEIFHCFTKEIFS